MKIKIHRAFIIEDPHPAEGILLDFCDLIGIQPVFFCISNEGRTVIPHCAGICGEPDKLPAVLEHAIDRIGGQTVGCGIVVDIRVLRRQDQAGDLTRSRFPRRVRDSAGVPARPAYPTTSITIATSTWPMAR